MYFYLLNFLKTQFTLLLDCLSRILSIPRYMWWIAFGAITHIILSIKGCLNYQKPNDDERYIYVGDGKTIVVKAIEQFRSLLKTEFYLDLNETFIVLCFI